MAVRAAMGNKFTFYDLEAFGSQHISARGNTGCPNRAGHILMPKSYALFICQSSLTGRLVFLFANSGQRGVENPLARCTLALSASHLSSGLQTCRCKAGSEYGRSRKSGRRATDPPQGGCLCQLWGQRRRGDEPRAGWDERFLLDWPGIFNVWKSESLVNIWKWPEHFGTFPRYCPRTGRENQEPKCLKGKGEKKGKVPSNYTIRPGSKPVPSLYPTIMLSSAELLSSVLGNVTPAS